MQQKDWAFPFEADGAYILSNVRDELTKAAITGGSGTATWYHQSTGLEIQGQAWPAAITWSAARKQFESEISAACVTTLGELVRGEIEITGSNGKKYRDSPVVRVKVPSG